MPVGERTGPNLKPASPGVTLASTGALCRLGRLMWGAQGGRGKARQGKAALGERGSAAAPYQNTHEPAAFN